MAWYGWVLLFLFFLILLVAFSEVKIQIKINKKYKNDYVQINMWFLYNLIHLHKKIPLIKLESAKEGIGFTSETNIQSQNVQSKKDRLTPKKLSYYQKQYKHVLNQIHDFYPVIKQFLKHIRMDQFSWQSVIGTGDAMNTGVLSGVLWGFKGLTVGIVSKYMKLTKKPALNVIPDFKQKRMQIQFECILRFRVGHVIVTGMRLLSKYLKGGLKNARRSSYSRVNENSYGKFKRNG